MRYLIALLVLFTSVTSYSQKVRVKYETKTIQNHNFYTLPSTVLWKVQKSQDLWGNCEQYCNTKSGIPHSSTHRSDALKGKRTVANQNMLIEFFLHNKEINPVSFSKLKLVILDTIKIPNKPEYFGKWKWGPEQANRVFSIDLNDPDTYEKAVGDYLGNKIAAKDNHHLVWVYASSPETQTEPVLIKYKLNVWLSSSSPNETVQKVLESDNDYYIVVEP